MSLKYINNNGQETVIAGVGGAQVSDIPTKTSQLENDSGFVTSSAIPTKTSQLTNDSGFVTSSSIGALTTKITSHSSGNMTANNTDKGTISFSATGPGSGWYPTCVTINSNTTVVLVNGVSLRGGGIAMTSAGNNTCRGSIFFSGNGGGNCRGTTTYYVTWAKIG